MYKGERLEDTPQEMNRMYIISAGESRLVELPKGEPPPGGYSPLPNHISNRSEKPLKYPTLTWRDTLPPGWWKIFFPWLWKRNPFKPLPKDTTVRLEDGTVIEMEEYLRRFPEDLKMFGLTEWPKQK
jgi:hypothetical protein